MIRRQRSALLASLVAVFAVVLSVGAAVRPPGPPPNPLNVILVSIDTLRADHLGCYGYPRETSPRIDAFSREAILFEEAIATASSTLPSHASMFTGLVPPHHGASFARSAALSPSILTLTEILRGGGYATASWNGGAQLSDVWGLDQGFDLYSSFGGATRAGGPEIDLTDDRLDRTVHAALDWIDRRRGERPFFLFLHSYEVHAPYTPSLALRGRFGRFDTRLTDRISIYELRQAKEGKASFGPEDLKHIVASYDAEIVSADLAFGLLLDGLRHRSLLDETVVVLTSDHGEEFGEHGVVGWHSHTLFDELLRVPLLIRLPEGRLGGSRVASQVSGIDVSPTILDALGRPSPAVFQGRSLMGLAEGDGSGSARAVLSARDARKKNLISLRAGGWKWIRAGGLYDLSTDPGEIADLRGRPDLRARRAAMRRQADRWFHARRPAEPVTVTPNQEVESQLRALGYLEP